MRRTISGMRQYCQINSGTKHENNGTFNLLLSEAHTYILNSSKMEQFIANTTVTKNMMLPHSGVWIEVKYSNTRNDIDINMLDYGTAIIEIDDWDRARTGSAQMCRYKQQWRGTYSTYSEDHQFFEFSALNADGDDTGQKSYYIMKPWILSKNKTLYRLGITLGYGDHNDRDEKPIVGQRVIWIKMSTIKYSDAEKRKYYNRDNREWINSSLARTIWYINDHNKSNFIKKMIKISSELGIDFKIENKELCKSAIDKTLESKLKRNFGNRVTVSRHEMGDL